MKIKKGDTVIIRNGKDHGKSGSVIKVRAAEGTLIVDGLNLYKKRKRPRQANKKGETVLVPRPLHESNVQIVCGACKKPTKIGMRMEGEIKVRYCRKCSATL